MLTRLESNFSLLLILDRSLEQCANWAVQWNWQSIIFWNVLCEIGQKKDAQSNLDWDLFSRVSNHNTDRCSLSSSSIQSRRCRRRCCGFGLAAAVCSAMFYFFHFAEHRSQDTFLYWKWHIEHVVNKCSGRSFLQRNIKNVINCRPREWDSSEHKFDFISVFISLHFAIVYELRLKL